MIIVSIKGGLGNQLFQWAYAYKLSKFHDVFIDRSFYKTQLSNPQITKREFQLNNILHHPLPEIDNDIYRQFAQKPTVRINDNFHYTDHHFSSKYNYYIDGYWQSEKYFIDVRNDILNSFDWPVIEETEFVDSCSIHVRRGDYLKWQHVHPVQNIEYYERSIEKINPAGKIYVFSDDIEWCKEQSVFNNCVFINNKTDIHDLRMMSMCTNHIISNSSFSWWGAWLNKCRDKTVIYPCQWFGDDTNISDLIPGAWLTIE